MIPLSIRLDDTDFDSLVEIARARLPLVAPEWTDYNYSDPGITLIELLAWIADTQIYSIGRNRDDEQRAMARLLGILPAAARPATGTLVPADPAGVTERVAASAGTRLVPVGAAAPRLELVHDVTLWPLEIASVAVTAGAATTDRTRDNAEPHATYPPFGAPPSDDAVLGVTLRGALAAGRVEISLGFELEQDAAPEEADLLGGLRVSIVRADGREQPVEIVADTTGGLRRSGAMILAFEGAPQQQLREIRFRAARDTLMPHLLRIAVNAIPVEQRATIRSDDFRGSGRPGQSLSLDPRFAFPPDEAPGDRPWRLIDEPDALTVLVEEAGRLVPWYVGRIDEAAAGDTYYEWSERSGGNEIEIRFGNGVNGRRPSEAAQIRIEAKLSAGAAGNVASSLIWRMDGLGLSWRNPEPIAGGADPDDTSGLLERLRAQLRDQRTLAASADIEAAARRLSRAYGIARAEIVEGWEPGRRRPASPATRTLLVTREGDANETDHWLRAISAALRPRIAIAERLVVAAPVRRRLGLRIRAIAERGRVPAEVERSIRDLLLRRLGRSAAWPLGRDVTATAVGGWVRGLAGVARVTEAALLDGNGRARDGGRLPLGTGELPSLAAQDIDVRVEAGASR